MKMNMVDQSPPKAQIEALQRALEKGLEEERIVNQVFERIKNNPNLPVKTKLPKLLEIVIDASRGIGRKKPDGTMRWAKAIRPRSKIFKVVTLLLNTEGPLTKTGVEKKIGWNRRQITRGIKGLNANARNNMGIGYDLIENIPASCELNRDHFHFVTESSS